MTKIISWINPLIFFINLKLVKKFPEFCRVKQLLNVCQEVCNLF